MAEETSLSTQQGMEMARGFSLIVATFIIANTFLITITQRRKQIGILRAIGATRLQIGIMIYAEAILMGILGSIFGCIVGVGAAALLTRAMGRLYETTLPPPMLTWQPFALAGAIGMGISFLGAALPARRARQLSPMDALARCAPYRDRRLFALAQSPRNRFLRSAVPFGSAPRSSERLNRFTPCGPRSCCSLA